MSELNLNENGLKSKNEEVIEIVIDKIENFPNHPFKVKDESLDEMMESISNYGVTNPLIIREKENGKYEMIAGHRRKRACELLGIEKVPCIIRNLSNDEAVIHMVDSNIQREEISISEKAFAYKMKYEALKSQGKRNDLTSTQLGSKLRTNEEMGKDIGESREQIRRYIRLTQLIPELLELVDKKEKEKLHIAFNPAVELSYLTKDEQYYLLDAIQELQATPSLSQAQEMKRLSQKGILDIEEIDNILSIEKGNQIQKYQISYDKFTRYIPRDVVTPKDVESYLLKCAIFCKAKGIRIDRLDIDLSKLENSQQKSKNRDAR